MCSHLMIILIMKEDINVRKFVQLNEMILKQLDLKRMNGLEEVDQSPLIDKKNGIKHSKNSLKLHEKEDFKQSLPDFTKKEQLILKAESPRKNESVHNLDHLYIQVPEVLDENLLYNQYLINYKIECPSNIVYQGISLHKLSILNLKKKRLF